MKLRAWFGLVLGIAIALCAVTLTVWKARKPILRLRALFHESAGLTAGAAIRVAGVEAGKVRSVKPAGPDCPVDVELVLPLTSEFRSLPQNASAQIQTEGVFGPSYVEIHLPQVAGPPIADRGTIQTVEYRSGL